jgi:hypothetical protein
MLIKNPSKMTHAVYVCLFTSVTVSVTTVNIAFVLTVVSFFVSARNIRSRGYQLY